MVIFVLFAGTVVLCMAGILLKGLLSLRDDRSPETLPVIPVPPRLYRVLSQARLPLFLGISGMSLLCALYLSHQYVLESRNLEPYGIFIIRPSDLTLATTLLLVAFVAGWLASERQSVRLANTEVVICVEFSLFYYVLHG